MEKVYYLSFYEGGRFSHHIGRAYDSKTEALAAITAYFLSMSSIFDLRQDGPDCFTYDRYGTPCMVRIEEKEV